MDERPPRQPDSSEPPEDSADTGADSRPRNPYRIPQRPPESEREETGGFSYERPAQRDEDPTTDAWDNPFRSSTATGAESGTDTPWGAPVPGDTGASSAETTASEDSWDTGTPWGAPVPGEEPRTSAFGSVGVSEKTPGSDEGRGEAADAWGTTSVSGESGTGGHGDAWDTGLSPRPGARAEPGAGDAWGSAAGEHDADDTWGTHASGTGLPRPGSSWGTDTPDDRGSGDAWGSRGASDSWGPDTTGHSSGAGHPWSSDTGAHDAGSARGEGDIGDAWDIGTTGGPSGAGDAWASPGSPDPAHIDGNQNDAAAFTLGSTGRIGTDTSDTWGTHAADSSLGSGAESDDDAFSGGDADDVWGAPSGAVGAWGSSEGTGAHDDAADAWVSESGSHDAWDTGTTDGTSGASDSWSVESGSRGTDHGAGSGPYDEHGAHDTGGSSGAGHSVWGSGSGDSWDPPSGDGWRTPISDTSQGAGAPDWGSTDRDDRHSGWGAPSGAVGPWGSSEGTGAHDDAADARDTGAADTGHTWGSDARDDRGAADTWGTSGPAHGTHDAWDTGHSYGQGGDAWGHPAPEDPGPSTAAFGSVGHPHDDEYQYGAAHGDDWGAWDNGNDENRGSGPNAAWGAGAAGAAGAAAWGASPYGESGDTEFYGDAHSGGQGWDDPYRGQPVHQGDTPYPGGPVQPPASEGYEYLYGGARGSGHGGHDDGYDADHGAAPDPNEKPRRKSRKGLLIGAGSGVLVLALIGGAIGWYVWQMPEPEEATAAFASSWENQDYEALAETTRGDDAAEILGGIDAGLGVDSIEVNVGQPSVESGEGSASYEVTVSLTNADDWGWEGELPLVREDGEWWVDFSPEVAYPGLGEGEVLARTAVWGERGHILAADGTRLDTPESSGSLQMIAGSLGEADEDDIERLGPAYDVGDTIGVDGLQKTHEEHLAGEAATTIVMADAEEAQGEGSVEATEENTVATLDGSDGEDITTSIDPNVQSTAASAIMEADDPAGLVALRPSSGEILAAVNVPGGFNRAFEGQYPPGSAFKIVSYSALLDSGMTTDATMDCPEEYELGGWPFRNAGEAEYGSQSVTEAFATSCNTALVAELGDRVSGEQLQASAEQFGMNQPLDIGVTTHEPVFPAVDSATALGSQGIGQGQILTSPLHMATLPAAIADGSWRHPVLVNEPEPTDLPEPTPIANAETIRPMMRAVVTDGTAEDLGFQGEVFAKTGTAEFGTAEDADEDDELPSHAWMVGYKGDVAFAVIVDGGGGGSSVAGPLAESFANGLP